MNANKTISVGDVMRANGGAGPGFDLLRLLLALAIFFSHSFFTSQGDDGSLWLSPARPLLMALVPMFFGLSGFLVTGSAMRTQSLRVFMTFRILRIVPALMTEVVLSAVILGALLTTLPLQDYYTSSEVHQYFGNIIGWIRFALPGVFVDNPMPGLVNVNLWTLKPEFACYAVMAGIIVTVLIRRTGIVATAVAVLLAARSSSTFPSISASATAAITPICRMWSCCISCWASPPITGATTFLSMAGCSAPRLPQPMC